MQQITNNLYVGDAQDALANSDASAVDVIIYLGQEIPEKLCFQCTPACIHLPLRDGVNGLTKMRSVLFTAYMASLNEGKVLVSCRAGLSRSIAVAAALYALRMQKGFDEALKFVKKLRPQSQPELHLLGEVKQVTEELKCCL